jgi:prophage antirepressor-like protein
MIGVLVPVLISQRSKTMFQLSAFAYGDIALTQTVLIKGIPHVTRQGIGEWLEYSDPQKSIDKILARNPHIESYSTPVNLTGVLRERSYETNVYHPIGFLLIVMESGQPKAKQKKMEVAEFVWHFSNPSKVLFKPDNIEPKEYRSILSRITNLTSKMAKIRDAMDHQQTWLEITVLCDTIGLAYPAIEVMRKHFKQVALHGADAPYMDAKPVGRLPQPMEEDEYPTAADSDA